MTFDFDHTKMDNALNDVAIERERQEEKWGQQNHDDEYYLVILGEEFGEACKAALQYQDGSIDLRELRDELIQVAAVAVAHVEAIDRRRENA